MIGHSIRCSCADCWEEINTQIMAQLDTGLSSGVIRESLAYKEAVCSLILEQQKEIERLKEELQRDE